MKAITKAVTGVALLIALTAVNAQPMATLSVQLVNKDGSAFKDEAKWLIRCKDSIQELHYGTKKDFKSMPKPCVFNVETKTHWGYGLFLVSESDMDVSITMKQK